MRSIMYGFTDEIRRKCEIITQVSSCCEANHYFLLHKLLYETISPNNAPYTLVKYRSNLIHIMRIWAFYWGCLTDRQSLTRVALSLLFIFHKIGYTYKPWFHKSWTKHVTCVPTQPVQPCLFVYIGDHFLFN